MKNTNRVTYWIKVGAYTVYGTLIIYKYFGDSKPLNYRTDYIETTEYHYLQNEAQTMAKYMERG